MTEHVLITGASSGIGESTARVLAQRGYVVHLAARRVERMEKTANEIRQSGGQAEVHELDLEFSQSIETLSDTLSSMDQPPTTLINNAGYGVYGRIDQIPIEEAENLFQVNLLGTMELTKHAVGWMKREGTGRIVNVTSGVAKRGFPIMNYYSASKAALESMSESIKLELEPFDITVQVVYPIRTETEFSNAARRYVPDSFDFPDHGPTQSAETVAETIADGLNTNTFRLHPHDSSRVLGTLNEWCPSFVEWFTDLRGVVNQTFDDQN